MFYVGYLLSELRRRRGRTLLTALGLGVGVGLVVTVSALSAGLDRAQDKVLKPLTGVGTDMSVTRPRDFAAGGGGPRPRGRRFGLQSLGKPGQKFTRTNFVTTQTTFPASAASDIGRIDGVARAAGGLTLNALTVSGTVPKQRPTGPRSFGGPPGAGGPRSIDVQPLAVAGVDVSAPTLAAVSPSQITRGRYLAAGAEHEAVLNVAYARRHGLAAGDTIKLKNTTFKIVGLARTPLGGQASDAYVALGELQALAGLRGRVNTLYVRAKDTDAVAAVSKAIHAALPGASVTTARDLADRVGGSLVDAKSLSNKLGTALSVVGLVAAFLIASLLTLSSVAKRVRELGTLKALGWPQRLVVRQVTGESLVQGAFGGVVGAALGIGGAALVAALAPSLKASVAAAATGAPGGPGAGPGGGPGGGFFAAAFGQGQIATGSTRVSLDAPVDARLLALAIALALAGGLLAGAVGGLRAARLRPAEALRRID